MSRKMFLSLELQIGLFIISCQQWNPDNYSKSFLLKWYDNLRKQPTLCDTTTGFLAKLRLRNECINSILMTHHKPDLASASDWSCCVGNLIQPIRSITQIWVVTRHQYGISALVSQMSFGGKPVVVVRVQSLSWAIDLIGECYTFEWKWRYITWLHIIRQV